MKVAINKILQKPLIKATASDIARACRNEIKKAGAAPIDTFTSGKKLAQEANVFGKNGKLSKFGEKKFSNLMNQLNLPQNSKISKVIAALKAKGVNFWKI